MTAAFTRTFTDQGDFAAYRAAESFLRARGFSVGTMQDGDPVGIIFGRQVVVAKWRHLTQAQRDELHGLITGDAKRTGPITIEIFAHAPAAARRAIGVLKAA